MKIGILKERRVNETRVALTPGVIKNLIKMGFEICVENGAGNNAHYSDSEYTEVGAQVMGRNDIWNSDVLVQVNVPDAETLAELPSNKTWISSIYHRNNAEIIEKFNEKQTSVLSLDAIPRISRAQSMDILSSQANLAGYRAVIEGAYHLDRIFPLLMTAAGTVTPAKVLIFGVGVAGLQAIATAKRLGAVVEATDVRPETKEQVESLGGKFIEVKGVEVGSEGGYAKEASEEYRKAQREAVNQSLAKSDLVITTALVPGKKAPVLIDDEQLALMKNGSVIIDMAAEQGGNCSQSKPGEIISVNGVKIVGSVNMPAAVSGNASDLFARNIWELLKLIGPKGQIELDEKDEIVDGCLITHQGKIRKSDS